MINSQEVVNYIGENSGLAKEVAKSAFKAARDGKLPAALAAVGVTAVAGIVVSEIVDDAINDVSGDVIGEAMIDVVGDILGAI